MFRKTGGAADEQQLVSFLGQQLQPAWHLLRIQAQARWAVLQALLLLREHKEALEAVVSYLETRPRNVVQEGA